MQLAVLRVNRLLALPVPIRLAAKKSLCSSMIMLFLLVFASVDIVTISTVVVDIAATVCSVARKLLSVSH